MNIYVGNLSYEVKESDLQALLADFGSVVSAKLIIDRASNRSKGFGFVEMEDEASAKNAIQTLNGKEHLGRPMVVKEAIPKV
ncbi:RNA-binding protein [Dysgonomonas sp. HDW5A]|uniref:RNA recognition motif domain-containing protein n=1 Tax=unclassified Dysgonomonas TaxID=2630389 RepID=UPI00140D21B1|nr:MULTISPECIES: RNA-binding protein [unclassified Dysgonomonas]QIK54939.1 RNA-binding protein [Dysgonomonas sp. HDW5B]QIK60372.1 RNA-binding protein [Dysgonomonas sp. HDW5A]